jgi:hypothetical protein
VATDSDTGHGDGFGRHSRDDGWRAPDAEQQPAAPSPHVPSLFTHVTESALAVLLAVALAAVVMPARVPLWMPVTALLVITAVTWLTAFQVTRSAAVAGYLLAWGLALSGWFTLARLHGVHGTVLFAAVLLLIVLVPAGVVVIRRHQEAVAATERSRQDKAGGAIARYWENVLDREGIRDVRVLEVIRHDDSLEIRGRLPKSAGSRSTVTYDELAGKAAAIAVSERRDEDGVYFSKVRNGSAADFVMHVRDKSAGSRKPVHLPVEHHPLTITRPIALGLYDSGREYKRLLREIHVQIIALSGMGKSNTINVLIDRLAGCPDVLIWMLDMKGGRTSRPWITPYLRGLAPRPVIDWLAIDRTEAKLMLETALKAIAARAGYPGFEKIHPTRDVPQIVIICDDVSVCFGHQTREEGISNYGLSQLGARITELGRSEAVMLVGAGQRANVELWGGTGMKSQSQYRIGMRVTSAADGAAIFPDNAAAARQVSRLRNQGDCLIMDGPDISPVVHLYRIADEDRILRRAQWAGDLRPEPEARLVTVMGEEYTGRWDRIAEKMDEWREDAGGQVPVTPGGGGPGGNPDSWEDRDFASEFAGIEAEFGRTLAAQADLEEQNIDPRRKAMWKILRDAGWRGLSVKSIVIRLESAGSPAPRETVHRWLAKDEQKGWVRRGKVGTSAVWIWAGHGDADYALQLDGM